MTTLQCPKCRHANEPRARFCSQCGQPLPGSSEAGEPAAGERRRATVLFCDLAGYTELNERLDPEQVDAILLEIKETARQVIEKHGGTVNQFVGDEIMALFGIPTADEYDAVNAIRAALELHAKIDADLPRARRHGLALHTGISSGLIIAQYENQHAGVYRSTGDAVNTAARLRALAGAGQVLIGPTTEHLASPYFELEPLGLVAVKGKSAAIAAYRVLAERTIGSRFDVARQRGLKGYVGRASELETLHAALARAVAGAGQLVVVEGEPGIGKTRLLYQFQKSIDRTEIFFAQNRCQPHGSEIPYFCFLDGLRHGLGVTEHDSYADALRKIVASIEQIDPALKAFLPQVLHLLAIPSDYTLPADLKGEALRRSMEQALAAILTTASNARPIVFVIEDWHWSDPTSQSALRYVLRSTPAHRLLVVVTYRLGYAVDFTTIAERAAIRLNPLQEGEADALIRGVTGTAELPPGLSALICTSTDGNPLFIEEACRSLLESGMVSVDDQRLVLHQPLDRLLLPDTVQAVIRARLDRLDAPAREIAGLASVVGRQFGQRILERIYHGRASLDEALLDLQTQDIVRQTQIKPEPEYTFRHVLTREVAYETLLHQHRKRLHAEVGTAIEALYPERLAENAPILAHHYAQGRRADKAVEFTLIAGQRAARLFANVEAAGHFDDALTLIRSLPATPQTRRMQIDAILGHVAAGVAPRDLTRDSEQLELACSIAAELDDRPRLARALYWHGRHHYVTARLERAIELARRSLSIADEIGDAALAAPPVNLMGRAYWQLSDFARSAEMMERSVEQMRVLGDKSEESTAAGFVSALFAYMGRFDKAIVHSDRSLVVARELKNPFAEAAGLHYRGIIRDQQGRWDEALADYAVAVRIAEAAGDLFRVYIVRFMEGRALQQRGDAHAGRERIEASIALGAKIGTTFLLGQAKCFLAACSADEGDAEAARAQCAEAIDLAVKAGDKFSEALALRCQAELLGRFGDRADRDALQRSIAAAIELQQGMGARPEEARSRVSEAWLLRSLDHEADAAGALLRALAVFDELEMPWDRAAAQAAYRAAEQIRR